MKKLIIAAVILVSMSVQAIAGPIVTIKIRIGKGSMDCAQFSFCPKGSGVDVGFLIVPNGTEGGTTLQINDVTKNLEVVIPASIWKEKANYFNSTTVTFDETVEFGVTISRALKSSNVIVRPGRYSFKKDEFGNVIIYIPQNLEVQAR